MSYPKTYRVKTKCLIRGSFADVDKPYVAATEEGEPGKETLPFLELMEENPAEPSELPEPSEPPERKGGQKGKGKGGKRRGIKRKKQALREKGLLGQGNWSDEAIREMYDKYFDDSGEPLPQNPDDSGESNKN